MTLTGLLFVVVSLAPRVVANHQATGVRAFISPNAVYFATTLVVSAVFLIPDLPTIAIGAFLFARGGRLARLLGIHQSSPTMAAQTSFLFWTGFGLSVCLLLRTCCFCS